MLATGVHHKSIYVVCRSGLDPESSLSAMDSRLRRDFNGTVYFTLETSLAAFTKMTGVMNVNLTRSAVILLHPPNRSGALMPMSEICVPCHLGESC